MKLIHYISSLSIITCTTLPAYTQNISKSKAEQYIETYKELAMAEQRRTGIPAAIKLGQGLLESANGESELAVNANAHFGIKCKSNWTGMTYTYDDDAKNECFRKYETALDSYMDHSDFLKNNKRYAGLFNLDITDYKSWAHELKRCGYATNAKYAYKLIEIIERYQLHQYTEQALQTTSIYAQNEMPSSQIVTMSSTTNNSAFSHRTVQRVEEETSISTSSVQNNIPDSVTYYSLTSLNGLKGFYAKKDDVLLQYAIQHKIRYAKLLSINDLEDAPLSQDMFIYLDKKRSKGLESTTILQDNESMHTLSQRTGVQLSELLNYNLLAKGEEPIPGSVIYLQNTAPQKPQLKSENEFLASTPNTQLSRSNTTKTDYINKSEISNNRINSIQNKPVSEQVITTKKDEEVKDVRVSTNKNNTPSSNEDSKLDPLIQQFDQSIYANGSNTSNPEVQKHFKGKESPKQFNPEEDKKNTKSQPQTSSNKPQTNNKNNNTVQKGSTNLTLHAQPNELLVAHMNKVRTGQHQYTHKASGEQYIRETVYTPAPSKPVTKKTKSTKPSNSKTKPSSKNTKSTTNKNTKPTTKNTKSTKNTPTKKPTNTKKK